MSDRLERLSVADLWMRDALRVCNAPGGFVCLDVDMTQSLQIAKAFAESNIQLTYNHLIFRAAALVLKRHPRLHKLCAGNRVLYPDSVDLGISITGDSFVAPVMVLRSADKADLAAIAAKTYCLMKEARRSDRRMRLALNRWGWIVPFAWMRRAIVSLLLRRPAFRRTGVGTFQISCLPEVDAVCPFVFSASALLGVGGMRDKLIVVDGAPAIRPVITMTCCADHAAWDGKAAMTFLTGLRGVLESGELVAEIPPRKTVLARAASAS